ncbi:uncharacterized protein APUU_50166A [Aspergillus puulaauensis]|uniref:Uncharacterized protein n=1 Tax=Aspergillus puulaauensis TaxID=1220207 RepID=A0A7R7XPU6_9EURO|nr:uncharacterized protein APUU_50166A [Aspergillus puulaauensis]BCS25455.1 hypothetical protein APUU_50166A [Aspergillus puulaauensis]
MRFSLFTLPAALFAAVASGHTVDCWGKGLNAPVEGVDYVIELMDKVALGKLSHLPHKSDGKWLYTKPGECRELACLKEAQVRWCNTGGLGHQLMMQNIVDAVKVLRRECSAVVNGVDTAGGVLYQPDNWNIILQQEDKCKDKK